MNFTAFAAGLVWALKKPLNQFFFARREHSKKEMVTAARALRQARISYNTARKKFASLEDDIAARLRAIESQAKAEEETILDEASTRAEHIIELAMKQGGARRMAALEDVKKHVAKRAITIATEKIKGGLSADAQKKIVERGLGEITKFEKSGLGSGECD